MKTATIEHIQITTCIRQCYYYNNSMDGMECKHPYWNGKGYENMIIEHGIPIPAKCPLRKGKVVIEVALYRE